MKYEHLLGRRFDLGRKDCFDLVMSFYLDNFGINIKNYARPRDWRARDLDLISQLYEREGFFKVQDWTLATLHPGDLLCMAINSPVANHMAVYLGGNRIVHHLLNSHSADETLRDFWRKCTVYVLRHRDVNVEEPVKTAVPLQEIIRERNRVQLK